MTPGTYLRMRRVAAGLTIEDVALGLDSSPALSHRARVDLLTDIEADASPVDASLIAALRFSYPFDRQVLGRLIAIHDQGANIAMPQLCGGCACSFMDPCVDAHGVACAWATRDTCTGCVDDRRANTGAVIPGLAA